MSIFFIINIIPADEDAPSKLPKVDIPSSEFVGGVVPGAMGIGFPPQSAYGAMQPMYAFFHLCYDASGCCIY